MRNRTYRLSKVEDYSKLVDTLTSKSENSGGRVGYMGSYKGIYGERDRIYYLFLLDNGAGIISSRDGGLIEMCVRNFEHAHNTKDLLSQLTKIPKDKFIPTKFLGV
ncbi:MAG: hypothetical protein NTU63_00595 [Candidatus Pacearchaeota archaeon]|nr:hypothetical protein [Candidatus Pacearchaeota archaeon]